jgi:hypothetical protein
MTGFSEIRCGRREMLPMAAVGVVAAGRRSMLPCAEIDVAVCHHFPKTICCGCCGHEIDLAVCRDRGCRVQPVSCVPELASPSLAQQEPIKKDNYSRRLEVVAIPNCNSATRTAVLRADLILRMRTTTTSIVVSIQCCCERLRNNANKVQRFLNLQSCCYCLRFSAFVPCTRMYVVWIRALPASVRCAYRTLCVVSCLCLLRRNNCSAGCTASTAPSTFQTRLGSGAKTRFTMCFGTTFDTVQ